MNAVDRPALVITTRDARRLEALLESPAGRASPTTPLLEEELTRAQLVEAEDVSPDVVTMNSRVMCTDLVSGEQHEFELVYPHEADADQGRISVLAPIGAALLGLTVGSSIAWPVPGGRMAHVRVTAVMSQPVAAIRPE